MARATNCTTVAGAWDGIPGFSLVAGIIGVVLLILDAVWLALAAFGVASLTPASMVIAATVLMFACLTGINLLHEVREYFFDHRLICLGPDRCAMAHVVTIEDNGDGDKSLNTVLAPANFDTPESDYRTFPQPAALVYVDPGLATRGWELDPKSNRSLSPTNYGHGQLPFFHCEIEGTKLDDWTTALIAYLWVLFALAVAAAVLAGVVTALGPIAWALWIIIAILAFLASLFGLSLGDEDTGNAPAGPVGDATPSPGGPIITDTGGNSISVGDYVAMLGRPICDSGHNPKCWNELHPLRAIARIRQSEYEAAPTSGPNEILERYCEALHRFVVDVGRVKQGLTAEDEDGDPKLTCLEHPRIG